MYGSSLGPLHFQTRGLQLKHQFPLERAKMLRYDFSFEVAQFAIKMFQCEANCELPRPPGAPTKCRHCKWGSAQQQDPPLRREWDSAVPVPDSESESAGIELACRASQSVGSDD